MRPVVLAAEDAAQVFAAVDGAVIDRRFADHAAILDYRFCAALEDAHHDAGSHQDSAEDQGALQHGRGEEVDERRVFIRLLQHVHDDDQQNDPESEPQKCGRHEGNSL